MSDTGSPPAAGYTKAELARHCHLPESTIRYYCARFAPYLPAVGEGRGRRYAPSCPEVLAFIRESLPAARTSRALDAALAERFPHLAPAAESAALPRPGTIPARFHGCEPPENLPVKREKPAGEAAVLRLLERQSEALERIAATLPVLAEQGRQAAALREQADTTDRELEGLRREVQTLRTLLQSAEKTQQDDLAQIRNWLGRLAKSKAHSED